MNKPKKKGIAAKLVKFAHRRRFQDYVREKGREKITLGYVYWAMWHRSGKGDTFELAEELFLADLGIGKDALRPARRTLLNDGWLSKAAQKIDPLTGQWSTTAWIVNAEPVACSTADGSTDVGSTVGGSTDVGSAGDTVVLHPQYAQTAYTSPQASPSDSTLSASTPTELACSLASDSCTQQAEESTQLEVVVVTEDKVKTKPDPLELKLAEYIEGWSPNEFSERYEYLAVNLPQVFGLEQFFNEHMSDLADVAHQSLLHRLNDAEAVHLPQWAKQHDWWTDRIVTVKALAKAMANKAENGLIAQYKQRPEMLRKMSFAASAGELSRGFDPEEA